MFRFRVESHLESIGEKNLCNGMCPFIQIDPLIMLSPQHDLSVSHLLIYLLICLHLITYPQKKENQTLEQVTVITASFGAKLAKIPS